jgi:hypothetical protein
MASDGGTRRMRMTFVAPADQRGVELLVLAKPGEAPVQYLWLPRSAELRRIAGAERGGRFQGSDFSFADFEDRDLAAAEVVLRGEEAVAGVRCHHLEITPRRGQAASPLGDLEATRVEAWVTKDSRVALRVQFFRAETLVRQLVVKRLQALGTSGDEVVPTRLVMRVLVRQTRTTLDITGLDPAARFPDAIFAPEALGR